MNNPEYDYFAMKAREELKELSKKYLKYKTKNIFWSCVWGLVIFICGFSLGSNFFKKNDNEVKNADKSRYIVISYDTKGVIGQQLFCSEVRKNDQKKEVVCIAADTGEVYILNYPVSIKDVTYTVDYTDYVNRK